MRILKFVHNIDYYSSTAQIIAVPKLDVIYNEICLQFTISTIQVAMYLETLQYTLEERVYHRRTRQVTQLFTYLLMHTLFSSCI